MAKNGLKIRPVAESETSRNDARRGRITAHQISMSKLADTLSRLLNGPVSNTTGAEGHYDVNLEWEPEDEGAVFTALQDQLGLKLEAKKLQADVLVVDRAEKPSEN